MTWRIVKLGDVCSINNGGTPKSKVREYWDGGIQWLTPKDMGKLSSRYVSITGRQISQEGLDNSSAKIIPEESVILSCRAPIGHVAINQVPMSFNQGCKGLVPTDKILMEYLYYFLISSKQLLNDLGTGTTFKEISAKTLHQVDVPLPPIALQKRIVAKLDAAFAEIDEAINAAEAKETEVQKLKNSLLSSSLNGDAVKWKIVKLGDMLEIQNGYAFNSKQFDVDGDMPLIRIRDLKNAFDTETCYTGEYDGKYIVQSGNLLIGMDGEFRCYEWQGGAALLNQRVCRLQNFHADLDQRFLLYAINSELKKIEDVTGFTTVKHLSSNTIKQIELSIPSLAEQQRIVAKLDAANSEFRNANEAIAKSKLNYLALKSAILSQELKSNEAA